jgi:hypothetical protein
MVLRRRLLLRAVTCGLITALHLASSYSVNHNQHVVTNNDASTCHTRRAFCGGAAASSIVTTAIGITAGATTFFPYTAPCFAASSSPLAELGEARKQLEMVPNLIQSEEWDKVRSILITPPLSDLWTARSGSKRTNAFWEEYAEVVADDEFAVLELKDELQSHLRYLDMAVYNNVFNPIKTFGETGATKELVRSYYDDPTREFKACASALDALLKMGSS